MKTYVAALVGFVDLMDAVEWMKKLPARCEDRLRGDALCCGVRKIGSQRR